MVVSRNCRNMMNISRRNNWILEGVYAFESHQINAQESLKFNVHMPMKSRMMTLPPTSPLVKCFHRLGKLKSNTME
jgi:hypothetical protein